MAKKKEEELKYLQMPLPTGRKIYKNIRLDWKGLNKRDVYNSGYVSFGLDFSTKEYPKLTPSEEKLCYKIGATMYPVIDPITLKAFGNYLIYIYHGKRGGRDKTNIDIIEFDETNFNLSYGGTLDFLQPNKTEFGTLKDLSKRELVQFNEVIKAKGDNGIIDGKYEKRLLIFPDKVYMSGEELLYENGDIKTSPIKGSVPPPDMDYITVCLSRLFGVKGTTIYASAFNDYSNWEVDTVIKIDTNETAGTTDDALTLNDGYDENHAWYSVVQSNTNTSSDFTGITTFQNQVIAFKRDFMYEIRNNKNPFRVVEIYGEGCISNESIQEVDGMLIFVSENGVMAYTGTKPKILSYELNINKFKRAKACSDGRNYYLWCEYDNNLQGLFVYDTLYGLWSERSIPQNENGKKLEAVNMTAGDDGVFMLCEDGGIYRLDTGLYGVNWSVETDFINIISGSTGTIDIKHIQKLQLYANIAKQSALRVYILYDEEAFDVDTSRLVFDNKGRNGYMTIRVIPRKSACYKFRLHIEGTGYVELMNFEMLIADGGAVNVSQKH